MELKGKKDKILFQDKKVRRMRGDNRGKSVYCCGEVGKNMDVDGREKNTFRSIPV